MIIEAGGGERSEPMTSPRLGLLIAVLLATATVDFAQQPDVSDPEKVSPPDALRLAPEWLQHEDPRERAWAAYWIGRDAQQQNVPQLLDALNKYQASAQAASSDWADDDFAALVMLDALIELNADVPPDLALALYPKFRARALLLLTRSHHDAREALLGVMDGAKQRIEWLAAADLLAANPPPGFAARLLQNISPIHATIQVLSPGEGLGGGGLAGDCMGPGAGGPRSGWPPVRIYWLWSDKAVGSELLVGGENPVYWQRKLSQDYSQAAELKYDCGNPMNAGPADLSRDLVGQLLGQKKTDFPLQLNPLLRVTWTSPKAYLDEAMPFVLKQEGILRSAEEGLQARGFLTDDEAASAHPALNVQIVDARDGNKTVLPELIFADSSIQLIDPQTESVN
jgi:hypothetical protein